MIIRLSRMIGEGKRGQETGDRRQGTGDRRQGRATDVLLRRRMCADFAEGQEAGEWRWAVAVGRDDYCDHTVARNLEGKSAALPFRRPSAFDEGDKVTDKAHDKVDAS